MNATTRNLLLAASTAWLLGLPTCGYAQQSPYESELNGWRLIQFTSIVDSTLGEPYTTRERPPLRFRAHGLGEHAYMVFGMHDALPQVIDSLQLTGTSADDMLPFKGLKLGDARDQVIAALGEPSSISEFDDPKVTHWNYAGTNYSVQLDPDGRLYSIRITMNQDFMTPGDDTDRDWERFVAAVRARDPGRLLETLRPDVEVYRDGEILAIRQRYRDFVASPDPDLLYAFFSPTSGVLRYLDECEMESFVRVTENMGVGLAYKFDPACPLAEVVLFPYAGEYRVYEVDLRPRRRGYAIVGDSASPH